MADQRSEPGARVEPRPSASPRRGSDSAWLAATIAIAVAGVAVRVLGARGDPWLDELWSWALAQTPDSALGVLALAHDNNHPLNTLWLRVVQGANDAWVWRIPALVFGAATLALVVLLSWRRSRIEAALACALCAGSFLLVTYQSEARGYAGMLLAVVLALYACRACLERPSVLWISILAAASVLGILSHPLWIQGWLALAAWTAWRFVRAGDGALAALRRWFALHGLPLLVLIAFAVGFLDRMVFGGGPTRPLAEIVLETCALALGTPLATGWEVLAALVVVAVLAGDVVLARRAGSDEWIATAGAVIVFPAVMLVASRPEFVAPRYFLVPLVFWLLALARVGAHLVARGGLARAAALLLVAATLAGNAAQLVPFLRDGRGHYRAALVHVQQSTTGPTATLASAGDFDITLVLSFFRRTLPARPEIDYLGRGPGHGAEWYLVQSVEPVPSIAPRVQVGPREYAFVAQFPYSGQSGAHWILYRAAR